jgi:hypothetical protein
LEATSTDQPLSNPGCNFPAINSQLIRGKETMGKSTKSVLASLIKTFGTKCVYCSRSVRLLANPTRLDGGRQGAQVDLRRQVGEIVFLLSRHPVFADQPSLVAWQMLLAFVPNPLRRSVGDPVSAEGLGAASQDVGDGTAMRGWHRRSLVVLRRTSKSGNRVGLRGACVTAGPQKRAQRELREHLATAGISI